MKLLIVNPNTNTKISKNIHSLAKKVARPETEIVVVNGRFGSSIIGSEVECVIAGHALLEQVAEHGDACDAILVAVSAEPALMAVKQMMPVPVVGMTEAAMLTACTLGRRFGFFTFGQHLLPIYQALIEQHGLSERLGALSAVEAKPEDFEEPQRLEKLVAEQCNVMVRDHDIEAIVLAGVGLAGLAEKIQSKVPVPLVDSIATGVSMSELLAQHSLGNKHRAIAWRRRLNGLSTMAGPIAKLADTTGLE